MILQRIIVVFSVAGSIHTEADSRRRGMANSSTVVLSAYMLKASVKIANTFTVLQAIVRKRMVKQALVYWRLVNNSP